MGRRFALVLASAVLLTLCVMGTSLGQDVFPVVTLDFEAATSTYTYHVVVPENNTYPFGQLIIFSQVFWDPSWTISGPFVGGVDQGWSADFGYGDIGDPAEWRAFGEQQVVSGPWEGDFVIVIPDTAPVPGQGMTKNGVEDSINYFDIGVPGEAVVPEPSALFVLGSLVSLSGTLIRRRRR